MPCVSMADTTETVRVDTLKELEVGGQKRLRVLDVLEETTQTISTIDAGDEA